MLPVPGSYRREVLGRQKKQQEKRKCKCQRKLKRRERASGRSGGQQVAMLLAWLLQRCPNMCRGCWDDPPLTVGYCGCDQLLGVLILVRTKRTPTELCKVLARTTTFRHLTLTEPSICSADCFSRVCCDSSRQGRYSSSCRMTLNMQRAEWRASRQQVNKQR